MAQKGCSGVLDVVTGRIGYVSCHLGSLLSAIEFTVLCVFVCKVGYFDAQIKDTLLFKYGIRLTCLLWKNVPNSLHGIKV